MQESARRVATGLLGLTLMLAGLGLWLAGQGSDLGIYHVLRLDPPSVWLRPVALLSTLGGAAVMIPFALAGAALLVTQGRKTAALWLFATIGSGRIAVELTKLGINRLRPDVADRLVPVISSSFPSSHSVGTMLTAAALVLAFRPPWPLVALAALWPLAVGFSRVMLGVHWPSDVLAGWGFGLLWVSLLSLWLPGKPRPS